MDAWATVVEERHGVAALAESLSAEQLASPSLCDGWSVQDVFAHLTVPLTVGTGEIAWTGIKNFGNVPKTIDALTQVRCRQPVEVTIAALRERAGSRFHPPGFGAIAPMTDLFVHGLDVRRPLGIDRELPAEPMRAVLDFLVSRKAAQAFSKKGITKGLRFEADDLDWSWGDGALVRGHVDDLLLALTGRRTPLPSLSGEGVEALRGRLAGSR